MNCEEVRELLPAYVLGVLAPEEVGAVEEHLRFGGEHDDELIELRAAVFAMDRYADEPLPSPSPALADRVRSITEAPRSRTVSVRRLRLPQRLMWPLAAAAIVVLLIGFGGGWLASRAVQGGSGQSFSYVIEGKSGAQIALSGTTAAASVKVTMAGLDRLPSGSAYQLWAVHEGAWETIGVCNTDADGWWEGSFPYALRPGEDIALTIEPAGGSPRPTSQPVLSSSF